MVRLNRHFLDARQLICPLPVIRTQDAIAVLADGDELEVRATDPGARHDIPAWCRVHGHEVLSETLENGEIVILIQIRRTVLT